MRICSGRLGIAYARGRLGVDLPLQASLRRTGPAADGAMQLVPALLAQHRRPVLVHQLVRHHAQLVAGHDVVRDDEHGLGVGIVEALGLTAALCAHGHGADQRLPVGADVVRGGDHDAAQAVGQHAHAADQLVHGLAHRGVRGRIDRWAQFADLPGQFLGHVAAEFGLRAALAYTGAVLGRAVRIHVAGPREGRSRVGGFASYLAGPLPLLGTPCVALLDGLR